jgi:hypothetical protein
MPDNIEHFIILLLGIFIAIVVVTTLALRRRWVHAERMPILAFFLSVFALLATVANTYFSFFWHPSDLRVYLRFPDLGQLGADTLDLNYFFSNMGNQAAMIEDVAIDELFIKTDDLTGAGELDRCVDIDLLKSTLEALTPSVPVNVRKWVELLRGEQHRPTMRQITPSTLFSVVKPTKIYIDGAEVKTAAATVEAGKMRVIAAKFETPPLLTFETAPPPRKDRPSPRKDRPSPRRL